MIAALPAVIEPAQPAEHPHQNFDRAARGGDGAAERRGVSTHAFIEAWSDWAQHLAARPAVRWNWPNTRNATC